MIYFLLSCLTLVVVAVMLSRQPVVVRGKGSCIEETCDGMITEMASNGDSTLFRCETCKRSFLLARIPT